MARQLSAADRNGAGRHGDSSVSSEIIAANPTIELHQNENVDSPNRVQVHTVIDFVPTQSPPPALPLIGATENGTEIIKTGIHTAVSNNEITCFEQMALSMSSQSSSADETKMSRDEAETTQVDPVVPDPNPLQVDSYGTRSLPCRKYGPYTCPRCNHTLQTPQSFASHMSLHYKFESKAQKQQRQALKYKKRNLRLVETPEGLTIVPESFVMDNMVEYSTKSRGKEKVGAESNGKGKRVLD